MKLSSILSIAAVVIIFGGGIFGGWKLHQRIKPCPTITTDTILVEDTSWHSIKNSMELTINNLQRRVDSLKAHPHVIQLPGDSIPVPVDVDTNAILKDYYTKYAYSLKSENDTVAIHDSVIITQNAPVWNEISYKFKIPFTTITNNIDNSIHYTNYLQAGVYVPVYSLNVDSNNSQLLRNMQVELTYTWSRGYMGVGWQPVNNTFGVRAGTTIFKFKRQK